MFLFKKTSWAYAIVLKTIWFFERYFYAKGQIAL